MNPKSIQAEYARAQKSLRAAQRLYEDKLFEDAVSRAYYAVMHAAKAALLVHDQNPEGHAAIRRAFGATLVRPGHIEKEWAATLASEQDQRIAADYDADFVIEPESSEHLLNDATRFVERILKYITDAGVALTGE